MFLTLTAFTSGVIILLLCADLFVKYASSVSLALKVSPLVIGTTIVAIGTSLPELVVSGAATAGGDQGLALGNIIGSNIVNVLLVLPAGIFLGKLRIGTTKTQRNMIILMIASCLFFVFSSLVVSAWIGLLLITMAVFFTIEEYRWGITGRSHEDKVRFVHKHAKPFSITLLLLLLVMLGGMVAGGILTVWSVERLAALTGLGTTVLGMTLTAVVTSLPELATTIFSSEQHQNKIVIGNIIGSNIYNLLLIGGVISLSALSHSLNIYMWILFITTTAILSGLVYKYRGQVLPKTIGAILLIMFAGYILLLKMIT